MTKQESKKMLSNNIDQVEGGPYKVNDRMVEELSKYSVREIEDDWDWFDTIVRNNS